MRYVTLILLALLTSSCATWYPSPLAPEDAVRAHRPVRARFHLADSSKVVLLTPRLWADSIVGSPQGTRIARMAIPVDQVRRVDQESAVYLVGLLTVALGAAVGFVLVMGAGF